MHTSALRYCVLLCIILAASGCADSSSQMEQDVALIDDLGREVHVHRPVERIVTLAPNLTEIVFAAGAAHKLAGVSTADDYPPAVDSLPRIQTLPINWETLAALEPDLVLATDQVNNPDEVPSFEALGIPVAFFSFDDLNDVIACIRTLGNTLGTSEKAEAAADSLERRIENLAALTRGVSERPLVLFLAGEEPLYSFGKESFVHDLSKLAGGRSATADFQTAAPVLSEEFVLSAKPDVIIGAQSADFDANRLLRLYPTWSIVPAVREGRVFGLDGALIYRPGPRLIEGAYRIAEALHPSLTDERTPSDASAP